MKWRPLLYRSSSGQPRQAIAPAEYSSLKCVSPLRVTLYMEPLDLYSVQNKPTLYPILSNIIKFHTKYIFLRSILVSS